MAKSTNIVKRKPGRPAEIGETGAGAYIGFRVPTATLERIDAWAREQKIERSEALRKLIEEALASKKRGRKD